MTPIVTTPGHVPSSSGAVAFRELPLVRFKYRDNVSPPPYGPLPVPDLIPTHSPLAGHAPALVQESVYAPGTIPVLLGLVERARRIDPNYAAPEFRNLRQVRTTSVAIARDLAAALSANPDVEFAYAVRVAPLPNVNAASDPYSAMQTQLDAPLQGVNARLAWAAGAEGSGVKLVDVEDAFAPHEDLANLTDVVVAPPPTAGSAEMGHGMAVLGIVAADDNSLGGIGISPKTTLGFASRASASAYDDPLLDPIANAIAALLYGDMLLLELQTVYADSATGYLYYAPIEADPAVRLHVDLAIASGITVIEPAGDSEFDVTPALSAPNSGAIMVGGILPATGQRDAQEPSGYGARVDCCGIARSVVTSGGQDSTKLLQGAVGSTDSYTSDFGGTSAAAAIVGGAASLLQSYGVAKNGYRMSPLVLRKLLRDTGAKTAGWNAPTPDQVGVMPDLGAAIQSFALPTPFFIRSEPEDDGVFPRPRPGDSPDLVAHLAATPDGVDPFSIAEWGGSVVDDSEAYVYVRALCHHGADSVRLDADVYCCPPSLIPLPSQWRRVGHVYVGVIPGDGLPHSSWVPLRWDLSWLQPWNGYSLIALVGNKAHRQPHPAGIRDAADAGRFYRSNRFVAVRTRVWGIRNDPLIGGKWKQKLPFGSGGSGGGRGDEYLLIEHDLAWASRVSLEIPTFAANVRDRGDEEAGFGMGVVELGPETRIALRLKPGVEAECALSVERGRGTEERSGEIVVRRMAGDQELGMMRAIVTPITRTPR
jgi:hypothetical protein